MDDGYPVSVANVVAWDKNLTFAHDLLDGNLAYLDHHGIDALVDDSAQVHDGATLSRVVVGARARIEAPCTLSDAVILPDSVITRDGSFSNVIVSPENWYQCQ